MNREILFRGKRVDSGEWVYGSYLKHLTYTRNPLGGNPYDESDYQHIILYSGFSDWNMPKPINMAEVDPKTVGQFTGFFDKYDSKIFQGDILQDNEYAAEEGVCEAVVEWDLEKGCWDTNPWGQSGDTFDGYEIIGNLNDNPDLLKGDL